MQYVVNMAVVAFLFCAGAIVGGFAGLFSGFLLKTTDLGKTLEYLFVAVPVGALIGGIASLIILQYATRNR